MKIFVKILFAVLLFSLIASCASSNKKCGGRKGTRTPMGLM